ncbi:helix-turn-helix domain-containing protein [Actinoplanes sp. NPDC024001]|uniref:TetR/AcrR family transcriptional regulator n=1 Tax=Actinoplanes sp. NPDC024001 TaxID=3154598 RepID=UPI0033C598A5
MARLTRVQQQARTRAAVLAAAAREFVEHGYADAKVDRIAERAELTRGAVYSNFPGKRSLYLAVLLEIARNRPSAASPAPPADVAAAAEAFARTWLERLPLTGDTAAGARLRGHSVTGVFDDEPGRAAMAGLAQLESLLLALRLESSRPREARRVRLAELILTLLHGADHLAQSAPGFGDPFDVTRACRYLAAMEAPDRWDPPHLPYIPAARPGRQAWAPPAEMTDALTDGPVGCAGDGVVVILGAARLGMAEEAVRAARPGEPVTIAAVTSTPAEIGALVRLRITDLAGSLRRVFGPAGTAVRLILDEEGLLAAAAGVDAADDTEAAVRIGDGEIVARADGRGAGHAAAIATGER